MLGKVPNPTTLGIFFPAGNVPKKGPRLDSPQAPAQSNPRSKPTSKRRSEARQEAIQGAVWVKALPIEGAGNAPYSRHCSQRREPDNVRESSEPDNDRNLFCR